jgi:hypothetical protein
MIITIFMPEYLIGKAFIEQIAARFAVKEANLMAPNTTQAYLANMGYFVLDAKYLMDKTPVDGGHLPGEGITEERRNNEQIGDIVEHILARAKIPD